MQTLRQNLVKSLQPIDRSLGEPGQSSGKFTGQILDVNNSSQVSSPQVLDVFLGVPQSHLLIFTGIAIPEYATDDDYIREQVIVKLGRTISNPQIPFPFSAVIGLASIGNTDSNYTFGTDDVSVIADPQSGELQLFCDIAVQGSSILHRFSYQANVIVQTSEASISGQVIWKNSVATALPQFANNLFTVVAAIVIPDPQGLGATFQKVADGILLYPPTQTSDGFFVDYVIQDPPLNVDLFLFCNPVSGAFSPVESPGGLFHCDQISGPSPVNLSPSNFQMGDVNFELSYSPPNR